MKTPMQELIDSLKEMQETQHSYILHDAIEHAESMLEKEKEVMCGIYDDAVARVDCKYIGGEAEEYYNETFNTKVHTDHSTKDSKS